MTSNKALFLTFGVFLFLCLVHVPYGLALKCYSCDGPIDCKKPKETVCMKQGRFPAPDRCWVHRETATVNGALVVVKDIRKCYYAYHCLHPFHCNLTNTDVECEAGCCKEDLCNHHGFRPSKPSYHKPNGADLSCYSCSDLPKEVLRQDLPAESAKCSKPVKRKCGVSKLHPAIIQDRCIALDVEVQLPNDQTKKMQYRTCADMSFCSNSDEAWNFILHDQMGSSPKTKASCCFGNLCNDGHVASSITCMTCLTGFAVLLLNYWM